MLTVQYEEVVADFPNQVRRLLEFCGLPWEDACLRFYESDRPVRTPSSEQVRQPIYDRSVGHWRHYAQHLDELLAVIEPIRDRYRRYESPGARRFDRLQRPSWRPYTCCPVFSRRRHVIEDEIDAVGVALVHDAVVFWLLIS